MHIAVIGAGIAGLACARRLVERGHGVTVFERADAPGGRVATLRTEIGSFDHGAQYFTTRNPVFVSETERWSADGIVEPWSVSARTLAASRDEAPHRPSAAGTLRWVGVPGMSAIASHLSRDLDLRLDARIEQLDAVTGEPGSAPRWTLRWRASDGAPTAAVAGSRNGGADGAVDGAVDGGANVAVTEGLFDAVIVAVPAERAAALLNVVPALAREVARARIEPCWALMLGFVEPIAPEASQVGDCAFVNSGRLAWIARESSKPERRVGERWTAHAQSAWSVEHFDDDPEDVKTKLLRAFHEATGTAEQPVYAAVHRWRYALARTALSTDYLWDAGQRVGACGDWCRGHRIEDAWLSGVALADAVDRC